MHSVTGFHFISMKEFLAKEALTGGLHADRMKLPRGDVDISSNELWWYLNKVADITPGAYAFVFLSLSLSLFLLLFSVYFLWLHHISVVDFIFFFNLQKSY